ncbi:MAG: VOC family protein [Pseudomonadota bacterium]
MLRAFTSILCSAPEQSAAFYQSLFGLERTFSSDWFVVLASRTTPGFELGLFKRDHELVPTGFQKPPAGALLTFVVEDCDALYEQALERGLSIVEPPRDLFYGQRRWLLTDLDGTLIDVSSPIPR